MYTANTVQTYKIMSGKNDIMIVDKNQLKYLK